jgi:hypothetical protein
LSSNFFHVIYLDFFSLIHYRKKTVSGPGEVKKGRWWTDERVHVHQSTISLSLELFCETDQGLLDQSGNIKDRIGDRDASRLQSIYLALSRACIPRDNRACVAHTLASWRGASRDKGYHRLGHLCFNILSGIFFIAASNLTTHDDHFSLLISLKLAQIVSKGGANDWIAANANAG